MISACAVYYLMYDHTSCETKHSTTVQKLCYMYVCLLTVCKTFISPYSDYKESFDDHFSTI